MVACREVKRSARKGFNLCCDFIDISNLGCFFFYALPGILNSGFQLFLAQAEFSDSCFQGLKLGLEFGLFLTPLFFLFLGFLTGGERRMDWFADLLFNLCRLSRGDL